MKPSERRPGVGPTARYTLIQGSYWACYCCILTFSSVYLLARGFSNSQIGVLISLSGILSAILQPVVSRFADGLKKLSLRQFTALLVGGQLAAGALLLVLDRRVSQTVLFGLLVILVQLCLPLCSALGMAVINQGLRLNFGLARGAGSVAFGAFSALCGRLVLWFGEVSIPVSLTVLNLVLLLSVLSFRFRGQGGWAQAGGAEEKPPAAKGKPFLRTYRHVVWVLVATACLFISHNLLNTFAFQIVQRLGGNSGEMGTMLFFQSAMELPVMFLFVWMMKKADSRTWTRLSGVGFFLHALGAWLAPNMAVMYAVQVFEMLGYAIFTLSSVYYVNETVDEDQRVQGQAWFTMCTTLGSVLASFMGGFLLDLAGAGALLAMATATGGLGMVLYGIFLSKKARAMER